MKNDYNAGDKVMCIQEVRIQYGGALPDDVVPEGTYGEVVYFPKEDDSDAYNDLGVRWHLIHGPRTVEVRVEDVRPLLQEPSPVSTEA